MPQRGVLFIRFKGGHEKVKVGCFKDKLCGVVVAGNNVCGSLQCRTAQVAATVGAAVYNLCDTFVGPFVSNEFNNNKFKACFFSNMH